MAIGRWKIGVELGSETLLCISCILQPMDGVQHNCVIITLLGFQVFGWNKLLGTESAVEFIIIIRSYYLGLAISETV
jgi:hypothetical protein